MEYVEKEYPLDNTMAHQPVGQAQKEPAAYEDFKKEKEKNLYVSRKMMGGVSKDITHQTILMYDRIIKGYEEDIRIRIYQPAEKKDQNPRPVMLFCHGGAFFGGTISAVEEYCKAVADRGNMMVVSVEYHLAPEFPFPTGVEDCYAALQWVWDNAEALNIDKNDVSVSGDSAGGNISAVLCLMARDRKKIKIKNQILIYPNVSFEESSAASPSMRNTEEDIMDLRVIRDWYLRDEKDYSNPYASPHEAEDLSRLPHALVVICSLDGLQDQGRNYAERLSQAGNQVKCIMFLNTRHAFIDFTGTQAQAESLIDEVIRFIS